MQPNEKDALQQANAAMDQIDAATTKAGTAVTGIKDIITKDAQAIADSDNVESMQALANRIIASAGNLTPVADALTQIASQGTATPVPTPVPDAPQPVA